jgi:hypothetical protein
MNWKTALHNWCVNCRVESRWRYVMPIAHQAPSQRYGTQLWHHCCLSAVDAQIQSMHAEHQNSLD